MNSELQRKFEKHLLDSGATKDVSIFNKDHNGVYLNVEVVWMYSVWVSQEAKLEILKNQIMKYLCNLIRKQRLKCCLSLRKLWKILNEFNYHRYHSSHGYRKYSYFIQNILCNK